MTLGATRAARWVAACVGLLAVPLLSGCGTATASQAPSAEVTRLAQAAQLAGIAEDIHGRTTMLSGHVRPLESRTFTPVLLRRAGVELPQGVRVVAYNRFTGISGVGRCADVPKSCTSYTGVANPMDSWQLCVADSQGRWLTYGDAVGVQATGRNDGRPACTYSGAHDSELDDVFDPRMFARSFYARATHGGNLIYSRDPIPLHADTLAQYGQTLPEGWRIPTFHQAGYTNLQYCLYAPDGRWFYTTFEVAKYGSAGRCHLDPRQMHDSE